MGDAYDYSIILNQQLIDKEAIRKAVKELLEKLENKDKNK